MIMTKKIGSLTLLLLVCLTMASFSLFGQEKKLQKEEDGFEWYKIIQNGHVGAKSNKGNKELIPLSRGYDFIYYHTIGEYFIVKKDGKSGVCDKKGKEIIAPAKYDVVFRHENGEYFYDFEVKSKDKIGVCDSNGKEIVEPKYDAVYRERDCYKVNCYKVMLKGKMGVCDPNGKEIIAPKYDHIFYSEIGGQDYYKVKLNGKLGAYDSNGKEIIPPKYDDIYRGPDYYEVKLNGKEGVCDSNGMEIIAPRYDEVVCLKNEGHYYYSVELKGKEGVCDISGNEIIPPKYKTLFYSSSDRVFMYENRSGNDVSTGIALDENGIGYKLSPSESKQVAQKKAKKGKKIDFGELLGIIADGLEDISETLEESNKMLQSLDPNNYNTPQNTYNSSFESSNNNNNYANNDEERKKKDEEYKQRKEERDNKAKQMEWLGKHGSTYTNLYMKWYEIIQDVKRKTITVENWEPEYRLSQLKTAQSKCKEIAKLYKEKTGDEIPCPKNDLDWVPSAKDLVGSR